VYYIVWLLYEVINDNNIDLLVKNRAIFMPLLYLKPLLEVSTSEFR